MTAPQGPDPFAVDEEAVSREAARIARIMARLRAPGGCPWDREQTHATLKKYAVEEVYEMLDAVDAGDDAMLREELGDVLLQVVFHAQMARERGAFSFQDVCAAISDKLVERHPHVFGETAVSGVEDVLRNWEAIKRAKASEKAAASGEEGRRLLDGVPRSLPALLMAYRIAEKTAHDGAEPRVLAARVEADAAALSRVAAGAGADEGVGTAEGVGSAEAGEGGGSEAARELIARLLHDLARLSARLGIDPEEALRERNRAWIDEVHACSD